MTKNLFKQSEILRFAQNDIYQPNYITNSLAKQQKMVYTYCIDFAR